MLPGGTFGNIAPSAIVLVPAAGGRFIEVTDRAALNQCPDGRLTGGNSTSSRTGRDHAHIDVMDVAGDGRIQGEPRRVSTGLGAQAIAFSTSANRLVYVVYTARANIWSLPIPAKGFVDTSGARALTSGNQIVEAMRVSNGFEVAVVRLDPSPECRYLPHAAAGGTIERLTTDSADDFAPDLSPDGREPADHLWRSGSRDIFVRPLDGGPLQQVTATAGQESYPTWSPDGGSLAFIDQVRGGRRNPRTVCRSSRPIQGAGARRWLRLGSPRHVKRPGLFLAAGGTVSCLLGHWRPRNHRRRLGFGARGRRPGAGFQ